MKEMKNDLLEKIIKEFEEDFTEYNIFIIANTHNIFSETKKWNYEHASIDEFFSRQEFAEIASAIFNVFGFVKVFYSETEFIEFVINNTIDRDKTIIYNLARDGVKEGKKSLIPAFCDLFGFKYTGSNAFVISLLRNKFIFSSYLKEFNIPIPQSYIFDRQIGFGSKLPGYGKKIVKCVNESASIGMTDNNIINISSNNYCMKELLEISTSMNTDKLLVQDYIEGNECEVLVFNNKSDYFALDPVMLKINGSSIITSDISNSYDYEFCLLSKIHNDDVCQNIKKCSETAARLLNIETYARFDFRVTTNGEFFLIDIAGTPYSIKHSSINYIFKEYGFNYQDIYKVVVHLSK